MNIVMVGAGKLGLPVALAIEHKGHDVVVVDPDARVAEALAAKKLPGHEPQAQELLATSRIRRVPLAEAVADADIVFVAVQTPHEPQFEGVTPLPDARADFNYDALVAACVQISMALPRPTPVAVISTVLPGTVEREILPRVSAERFQLVYNPSFVAMGTVVKNFLFPEFTLLGGAGPALAVLRAFYERIHDRVVYETTVANAELIKVAYNTFIGQKIVFANALMELCHKLGCDVDAVTDALCLASHRLISPAYLMGGMGDGGGCHPRDQIALSWLAREHTLSCDIFTQVMAARERQTDWLATLAIDHARGRPIVLLGTAYKANSPLTTGSAALLLSELLTQRNVPHGIVDPWVYGGNWGRPDAPTCFLVTCNHEQWHQFAFRAGDTVVDPWRMYGDAVRAAGAEYVGVGQAT